MGEDFLKLKKELMINRICSIVVAILLVGILAGGAYVVQYLEPAVTALEELQPLAEKLEELDIAQINEKIATLDVEGMNEALEGLDTKELTEALKNMNDAAEEIKLFGENLQKIFGR